MPRPRCCRRIASMPGCAGFKPVGAPSLLPEIQMTLDEFEAVRLADYEFLYHEQAAGQMNVSRQTFGRIIDSAHRKIAEAIVEGKPLRIEGGDVEIAQSHSFKCRSCRHSWNSLPEAATAIQCPLCESRDFQSDADHDRHGCGCPRCKGNSKDRS